MVGNQEVTDKIKGLFKGMYDLSDSASTDVIQVKAFAIENPDNFVLKPLKEGGGNNFFGLELQSMLLNLSQEELGTYLLMEKINAPEVKTHMLKNGKILYCSGITEIGIYSFVVANSATGQILENEVNGCLARTKVSNCNEGGVSAGFAVIDHLYPVDMPDVSKLKPLVQDMFNSKCC